eukprot:UC1_evm4s858
MSDFGTVKRNKWKVNKARKAMNVGTVKPRTIKIEDSNIANLGMTKENLGIQIWRIEDFKVVDWPKERYGEFYSGDSYIVLHTYKKKPSSPKVSFDIYFWLGKNTSSDEAGTAAYKTVELDTFLSDEAVQSREVQDFESPGFLGLFEESFKVLEGGVDSGFNHVKPEEYQTRLLQCKGQKPVRCRQIECKRSNLNSGDVFILDTGLVLYQLNGKESRGAERAEAAKICRAYDDERAGKAEVIVWDEGEISDCPREFLPFWNVIGGEGPIKPAAEGGLDTEKVRDDNVSLWRLKVEGGKTEFTKISSGKDVKRADLQSDDVFIFDSGYQIFIWIGLGANKEERSQALKHAQEYFAEASVPDTYPITKILQGGENEAFEAAFRKYQ